MTVLKLLGFNVIWDPQVVQCSLEATVSIIFSDLQLQDKNNKYKDKKVLGFMYNYRITALRWSFSK